MTIQQIRHSVLELEDQELRDLNSLIVNELRTRRSRTSQRAIIDLALGQKVIFRGTRASHGVYPGDVGEIIAVKQTKVHVRWERAFGGPQILVCPAAMVEGAA